MRTSNWLLVSKTLSRNYRRHLVSGSVSGPIPIQTFALSGAKIPTGRSRTEEPLAQVIAGEGAFEGDLLRFGHGLQRSFLLALLQELASLHDEAAPSLIIGIGEPELYQHPPQAKHLANVLERLSSNGTQVIVCTHSPYFAAGPGFSSIRLILER